MSEQPSAPPRPPRAAWQGWLHRQTRLLFLIACVVIGLGTWSWLGDAPWWANLAVHFPWQGLLSMLGLAVLFVIAGSRVWAGVALLIALWQGYLVAPAWTSIGVIPDPVVPLRVVTCNVLKYNQDTRAALAWIREVDPDVFALQETTPLWAAEVSAACKRTYPYQLAIAREDSFGMVLYSRFPAEIRRQDMYEGIPAIRAVVTLPSGVHVVVYAVHPPPATMPNLDAIQDGYIRTLTRAIAGESGPVLAIGDFNLTPWSPRFTTMLSNAELADSRLGHGNQATWPQMLGVFGIPIDHILMRGDLRCVSRAVSPDVGSDHHGVVADLRVMTGSKPAP